MKHRRIQRVVAAMVATVLLVAVTGPAFAVDGAVARSLIIPGAGQAQKGHYTKAALFASAAVIFGAGLFATQVQYNRSVETLDTQKRIYNDYGRLLEDGHVYSQAEIDATYQAILDADDDASGRAKWRNAFLGAFIATYALNVLDAIITDPDTGEIQNTAGLSVEMSGTDVRVVKSFSF